MDIQHQSKLNRLSRLLPDGLLVDAAWLEKHGYSRALRSHYVAAGWLQRPVRGVYRRPGGDMNWEQVVISLQSLLHLPVSVGGRTALDLHGYTHYLSSSHQLIHLYSDVKLPRWLSKINTDWEYVSHNRHRFLPARESPSLRMHTSDSPEPESMDPAESTQANGIRVTRWGQWHWPLVVSTAERAILELIDELPGKESFDVVDRMMEGLVDLSPERIQTLLEATVNVKVKRLFFFFADRHNHSWLNYIERENVDLGSGKRMLVKGGKLDQTYQITIPRDLADGV